MRIIFSIVLSLFFCFSAFAQEITILHTNDIHCGVDEGVELSGVSWLKQVYKEAGLPVVLVDAGDAVQGAPLGTLTRGAAIVRLMNAAEYDFAVPGNHEFDYGIEDFKVLAGSLSCQYYSANITERGKLLLEPYKMFYFENTQVAFVGVTTPMTLFSANPSFFYEPGNPKKRIYSFGEAYKGGKFALYSQVQKAVNQARKKGANYVILVAHLGNHVHWWSVRDLLKNLRGVDAVIDGHSHENYIEKMPDATGKEVLVTQTGSRLACVGRITISDDGKLKADKIRFVGGKDELVAEGIRIEKGEYEGLLMSPLGHTGYPLCANNPETKTRMVRNSESNLGDLVADAYRIILGANIGVANGGGLRGGIGAGMITYRDALTVSPFGNRLCVVELSGQQLLDVLEYSVHRCPEEFGGFLQVSGLSFDVNLAIPSPVRLKNGVFDGVRGIRRVSNVKIGGVSLVPDRMYTVAGSDFTLVAGGDGYTMLQSNVRCRQVRLTDMDALQEYIHTHLRGIVPDVYRNPQGAGRINFLK